MPVIAQKCLPLQPQIGQNRLVIERRSNRLDGLEQIILASTIMATVIATISAQSICPYQLHQSNLCSKKCGIESVS